MTGSSTTQEPTYCIFRLFARPEESRFYILYGYAAGGAIFSSACAGDAGEDMLTAVMLAGWPANAEAIAWRSIGIGKQKRARRTTEKPRIAAGTD